MKAAILLVGVFVIVSPPALAAGEWSGFVGLEYRGFNHAPLLPEQHRNYFSLAAQPEYRAQWDNGRQGVTFVPFARASQYDNERTHADIRELTWFKTGDGYEWRVGIRKVFWGVVESQHLVDIINQTDLVENIDTEDKLGQPMVNLALIRDWGTLDLFVLPGFRERTFPGVEGRLRTNPRVDTKEAMYESAAERGRVDLAARWSKSLGAFDVGVSQFNGTSREPRLVPRISPTGVVLIPFYEVISQTGLDVQATLGAWLWKLEAIRRSGQSPSFTAATGGFEYSFTGVFGSGIDLGVLAEFLYDDRGTRAPTPFQKDVLVGARLGFNDAQSSEILVGVIADRDSDARFYNLEASRRIGDQWKLSVEARAFADIPHGDPLFGFRRDDYLQLELARYF